MEVDMNIILAKISEEMRKQGDAITRRVTDNLTKTIDEKMKILTAENQQLKEEIDTLKTRVKSLEKDSRKKNLILHGIPQTETNSSELMELILETLNKLSEEAGQEKWDKWELSKCYRIGKNNNKGNRPILIAVTLEWRRDAVLKNNKKFPEGIYATEDLPKEVLNKRKELIPKLQEEREKGNIAYFSYDQLIVKEKKGRPSEKRKRAPSNSPAEHSQEVIQNPSKINTMNKYLQGRSRTPQKLDNPNSFLDNNKQ